MFIYSRHVHFIGSGAEIIEIGIQLTEREGGGSALVSNLDVIFRLD